MPRVAIPAKLRMTAGEPRDGEVYVMERVPQHVGPETPLDMLNRPEGFFPFRPRGGGDGGVLLVAKARTVTLTVPPTPEDAARSSAAKHARLVVTLADGSELSGSATLELPEHHSRLLDYLNASPALFFAIAAPDQVHLINRAHVLFARPGD